MSSADASTSSLNYDSTFSIFTSFAYYPHEESSPRLDRHLRRLTQAHKVLAKLEPQCWCNFTQPLSEEHVSIAIRSALDQLKQDSRIRVSITKDQQVLVESFPLKSMPNYPVKLVLDDQPTVYEGDSFMFVKTTNRTKYDDARNRKRATLVPSNEKDSPPFDVILYNPQGEITETSISNIAFKFTSSTDEIWRTPSATCGLLEGVKRSEMLEKGEITEGIVKVEQILKAAKEGTLKVICFNGVRGIFEAFIEI